MNGDDSLDALFDELRQPATASELAGESNAVDAAVTALMSTKGTSMQILSSSRRLRVASFVAAGIIGFGGVAAAGPAVYDTVAGDNAPDTEEPAGEPSTTVVATTLAPEQSVTETTTTSSVLLNEDPETESDVDSDIDPVPVAIDVEVNEATTTVALIDDPDTKFDETTCAEGNHGQTVSSIAHETPSGPGKGQIVSEAAHSSCGKDDKHDDESDDDESDDDESDDDESDDDDKADKADKPSKPSKSEDRGNSAGGGKGNSSNGNGQGKGKGKHKDD